MQESLVIRSAVIEDKESIFELANQLSDFVKIDKDIFISNYHQLITDQNYCVVVAKLGERIVGYLSGYFHKAIYANGLVGYVDEIVVLDTQRNLRIGTMLMNELEIISRNKNCILISLATAGAKGFYEKIGYSSKAGYFKKYL
jgi:ribosomal protein S18 acetylase RimI-like enzyme